MALRISVLVPVLNEAPILPRALGVLGSAGFDEVIVADGGSTDGTPERARDLATRVVQSSGGISEQLNLAAAHAVGDVFVFHYADVLLPPGSRAAIERAVTILGAVGGAFRLAFDSPRRRYRVVAWGANLRNRLGVGPFGDQSIFATAEAFRRLGGLDAGARFGDLDLVRKLRRAGRFVILPERVLASPRRYERLGLARTLLRHWRLTLACALDNRRAGAGGSDDHPSVTRVR